MSGYWWLSGKTYLRERRVPEWLNKDACVPPEHTARYEVHYSGPDRALPLLQRPQFSVEERERRILDLRCTTGWSLDNLAPFFLISRELADTIKQSMRMRCMLLSVILPVTGARRTGCVSWRMHDCI